MFAWNGTFLGYLSRNCSLLFIGFIRQTMSTEQCPSDNNVRESAVYHSLVLLRCRTWIGFSQCDNRIIIIILLLSGKQWYFNIGLILLWPPSTTHHPASQPGKPTQREIEKDAIGMITLICRIRCPALLHSAAFSNYVCRPLGFRSYRSRQRALVS